MEPSSIAQSISSRFERRWLRGYVKAKIGTDPAYSAVYDAIRDSELPLLDIGCGVGLLAFYLRERGWRHPVLGIDSDEEKIEQAKRVARSYAELEFRVADSLDSLSFRGNVAIVDVIHYLADDAQVELLQSIARLVPAGGMVLIRDTPDDGNWRTRATWIEEVFARSIGWMRTRLINFPPRDRLASAFVPQGFTEEVRPLWGRTPFNSHFWIYRKSASQA